MKIFHYDPYTGVYTCEGVADRSPLEANVWLLPAYATFDAPPKVAKGQQAVYVDDAWQVQDIPVPPAPKPAPELTPEPESERPTDPRDLRADAFRREADPLFFQAQRGEATMEDWLAKVDEIRARYPYDSTEQDSANA